MGLLLESIHLQAAAMDKEYRIRQYNQQPINIVDGPIQLLTPLITRMAARNRTTFAEGKRAETEGLNEIDNYATNAKHKEEVIKEDKVLLRISQSGSSWTKAVTAKTGREDVEKADDLCELCRKAKETSDHVWKCEKLASKRREIGS